MAALRRMSDIARHARDERLCDDRSEKAKEQVRAEGGDLHNTRHGTPCLAAGRGTSANKDEVVEYKMTNKKRSEDTGTRSPHKRQWKEEEEVQTKESKRDAEPEQSWKHVERGVVTRLHTRCRQSQRERRNGENEKIERSGSLHAYQRV